MDDTDSSLQFSEDDIRQQLAMLGYHNIPAAQLQQFAQDLDQLIKYDTDREGPSEASSASDSDYTAEDLRLPLRHHHMPSSSAAGRRPVSAPSKTSRTRPVRTRQSPRLESSKKTSYPAKHPQPFSYKYGDTSPGGLDTTDDSTPGRERSGRRRSVEKKPAMKRKVVRKMNGESQVFDESITGSESGDLHEVNDRLSRLALRQDAQGSEVDDEDADTTLTETDDSSSLMGLIYTRRPHSSTELYSHRPAGDENTVFKPHLPRSFIRPDSAQPRTKHDKKTDPVSRHQMYKAEWSNHRAPGEKNRNDLRWSIREQMMYKDTVAYPRRTPRVFSANNYVVPTDKKRQALRWAVRTSLAHKQMPASTFY
ncbi:hydrolethalus syndrome protein 1-like isoform X2 [Patiria miniata]|uniref:Centriolar and ciliogenesis-associated protein HYLS1 C-terminal domain-containing protein n=1 Tax=Patiria miniata TaxID=46514 RepID=A0A914BIH7_PATMI|nr:hydrolethalus syndrome protein 1-like isoform X2 [Patiria miniata]